MRRSNELKGTLSCDNFYCPLGKRYQILSFSVRILLYTFLIELFGLEKMPEGFITTSELGYPAEAFKSVNYNLTSELYCERVKSIWESIST